MSFGLQQAPDTILYNGPPVGFGQQAPDTILYNGKIVTVDNHEVNEDLGTLAQALAIGGNTILAVGTNAQVRALAGPNTKNIDLKGRMVTPGFAATHDHPDQWNLINPYIVPKVVTDDIHIERFLNDPPNQQIQQFPRVLDEAVRKAKPGQWIRISMLFGKEYRWGDEIMAFFGRQITKDTLNLAAPDNPVIVRGGFTGAVVNQRALDELRKHYGKEWDRFGADSNPLEAGVGDTAERTLRTGVCSVCYRYFEMDVIYPTQVLSEIYRQGLSWLAGYGQTLNASNMYTAGSMAAYTRLDRLGLLPIRFAYTWYWPPGKDLF